MSIHKLTAGDGYAYLTRQVAALDATDMQHTGLADYYSQRGEVPGRWVGSALADVDMRAGQEVTADQMAALFAEGRHPNADQITATLTPAVSVTDAVAATELGKPFPRPEDTPAFQIAVARWAEEVNVANVASRDTVLAAAERARIRTEVGREMFAEAYGRAPKDPRELSSFIARNSRSTTSAIAGFDLTFTPVKSVSALWAIAPRQVAEQITAAHHAAVEDVLGWLEREASYTRGGKAGVQQLDTTGLIAAAFDHRDSRAGDPDLHTHVAVSSKVRVLEADGTPGRWLALDARVLFKATVTASERYNTRIEASPVPTRTPRPRRASEPSARSPGYPRSCPRAGPSGGPVSTCGEPPWRPRSRPSTAARRPRWRRSSWPSRPPWRPGTPSTHPAPRPSSEPPGVPRQRSCSAPPTASTSWSGTPFPGPHCVANPDVGRRPVRRAQRLSPMSCSAPSPTGPAR